jgi:hypothetical protein
MIANQHRFKESINMGACADIRTRLQNLKERGPPLLILCGSSFKKQLDAAQSSACVEKCPPQHTPTLNNFINS